MNSSEIHRAALRISRQVYWLIRSETLGFAPILDAHFASSALWTTVEPFRQKEGVPAPENRAEPQAHGLGRRAEGTAEGLIAGSRRRDKAPTRRLDIVS